MCDRRLTLENRGRRKQRLRWINETINEARAAQTLRIKKMELEVS